MNLEVLEGLLYMQRSVCNCKSSLYSNCADNTVWIELKTENTKKMIIGSINCYWQGMYALKLLNYCIICIHIRVGVKYSTCTWYLYLSTYLSVLDVLEYLVYGNAKVLVLVLVLDQKVLGTYK